MRLAIGLLALVVSLPSASAEEVPNLAAFPRELQGVWDVHPWPCVADESSDSDMRFKIGAQHRANYEDRDTLKSIRRLADSPSTWLVHSTSSLDPLDATGDATIYVLKEDTLAVTDGERAEVYVRCK